MRYLATLLVLLAFLFTGSTVALAAGSSDPVRSALERGDFVGLLRLAKDQPALADAVVEALLQDARNHLPTRSARAAQAMDAAAKLAGSISRDAALRVVDNLRAVMDDLKAPCGGTTASGTEGQGPGCPDAATKDSLLASVKILAEAPVIKAAEPTLYAQITDPENDEPAQLAQQPNQGPPALFFVPTPPPSEDSASPTL